MLADEGIIFTNYHTAAKLRALEGYVTDRCK